MPINTVIHTNQYSIDRVLNAGVPVLLLFADAGHPPAPELEAALDDAAGRHAGRLLAARVDAAAEAALLARFQVRDLPALVVATGGQAQPPIARPQAADVRDWVRHLLEGGPRPAGRTTERAAGRTTGRTAERTTGRTAAPPPPAGHPVELTDATFAGAIAGPLPVLVDFWAPWCGPCRMIAPSVERLAQEYSGRAVVAKLNVDENPVTPGRYGIRGIPALLIFKRGQVVDQIVGAQPYAVLQQRLARHAG